MAEPQTGKVVAIAGAAQGVGRAVAQRFAEAGDRVYLIDADRTQLEKTAKEIGGTALTADPADAAALQHAFVQIEQAGGLDAYVHAPAAIVARAAEEISSTEFENQLVGYVGGAFAGSQLAARLMFRRSGGSIVHIASVDAIAPRAGYSAVAAVQAGVLGLTRALGIEWSARGVRVNAIAHGVVEGNPDSRSEAADRFRMRTPLGRFGRPAEVAEAVLFLTSDEAQFITAECLRVDGGWLAYSYFYPAVTNSEHR